MNLKNFKMDNFADKAIKFCPAFAQQKCREYARYGKTDREKIIKETHDSFKGLFCKEINKSWYAVDLLGFEEKQLLKRVDSEVWPKVLEEVDKIIIKYGIRAKEKDITKTTARAFIVSALKEAGFDKYYINCQCYRAKTTVYLPSKYSLTFIIKYKEIREGKLDEYINKLFEFISFVGTIPFEIKYWK